MTAEEVAEGVEFADAPFRGGGQVGLDEREFGESFEGSPAASGAALLDLDGPDCPLGFVVGEDVQVGAGGEAQDQVLEAEEAAGEPAGVFGGGGPTVETGGQADGGQCPGRQALHLRSQPPLEELVGRAAITVGIGGPAAGLAGFRQAHAEAERAAVLADSVAPAASGRILRYRDVELVALLAADMTMARAFVTREVGPLAQRSRAATELRQTLAAYLDTERSLTRAAEHLHIARNTVAYRVRKAENLLHRDLRERTTELQCALRLATFLPAQLLGSDHAELACTDHAPAGRQTVSRTRPAPETPRAAGRAKWK